MTYSVHQTIKSLIVVTLFLVNNEPVIACPQECVPVLESYELLEEQVEEIGTRYPTIQAMIDISKLTGANLDTLGVTNSPNYEDFQKEQRKAVADWFMRMRDIWTGAKSENVPIMLKMFEGALQRCQATCY